MRLPCRSRYRCTGLRGCVILWPFCTKSADQVDRVLRAPEDVGGELGIEVVRRTAGLAHPIRRIIAVLAQKSLAPLAIKWNIHRPTHRPGLTEHRSDSGDDPLLVPLG